MDEKKIILILTSILSGFAFVVAIASVYVQSSIENGTICRCVVPISLFIPIFASIGLLIGSISYYIFLSIERKPRIDSIKKLLDKDEARVLDEIIKGKNKQYKISRSLKWNRVKTFRMLRRLEEKGIIKREKEGKVVKVELSDYIKKNFRT